MSDPDFRITASELLRIAEELEVENPGHAVHTVIYGADDTEVAAVLHTSEIRPDMLTFLLAVEIHAKRIDYGLKTRSAGRVTHQLTQIMGDLEPVTTSAGSLGYVTYWKNVELVAK